MFITHLSLVYSLFKCVSHEGNPMKMKNALEDLVCFFPSWFVQTWCEASPLCLQIGCKAQPKRGGAAPPHPHHPSQSSCGSASQDLQGLGRGPCQPDPSSLDTCFRFRDNCSRSRSWAQISLRLWGGGEARDNGLCLQVRRAARLHETQERMFWK